MPSPADIVNRASQREMQTYLMSRVSPILAPNDSAAALKNFGRLRDAIEEREIFPHLHFGLDAIREISESDPERRRIWPMYDAALHPHKPHQHAVTVILRDVRQRPVSAIAALYCQVRDSLARDLERGEFWYEDATEMRRREQTCIIDSPLFKITSPCCILSALWGSPKVSEPVVALSSLVAIRLAILYAVSHWNCDVVAIGKETVVRGYAFGIGGMAAVGRGVFLPYDGNTLSDRARMAMYLPRREAMRLYLDERASDPKFRFWQTPLG